MTSVNDIRDNNKLKNRGRYTLLNRVGISLVGIAAGLILYPSIARACHDDNDARTMIYYSTTVHVDIRGVRVYDSTGKCETEGHTAAHPNFYMLEFTARGSWDPATNRASEIVTGSPNWKAEAVWSCPSDPWITRHAEPNQQNIPLKYQGSISCSRQSRSSTDDAPALITDQPFSSSQSPIDQLIQQYNKALPLPPALPPRDVKASVVLDKGHVSWGIPVDQTSIHQTIAWFKVERRPAGQPQVSWFAASSNLPANTTAYADPNPLPSQTEYRVCALNISGSNCSDAVLASSTIRLQTSADTLRAEVFPSVLSPIKGQNFVAQNPVPIKLAPPKGWTVTAYMVNVLINGYSCNLPVGAAQAQSATGYTDFGAGKPPCFSAIPGSYRLRAQVSSPKESGWSDWIDFTVRPPRFTAPAGVGGKLSK